MLSEEMTQKLNKQINLEFYSSNLYLQMAAWCEWKALENCATFLRDHADEERQHMDKLFQYVLDTGELPIIGELKCPQSQYRDIRDIFQQTYEHECCITREINALADLAFQLKDYSTFNFLQWYVAEQHEEEKLFKTILDKIDIIGLDNPGALFYIDKEVGEIAKNKTTAQA